MALRSVGFDPAPKKQGGATKLAQQNYTGFESLNTATQALQRSGQYETQSAGQRSQVASAGLTAVSQQSRAQAQSEIEQITAKAKQAAAAHQQEQENSRINETVSSNGWAQLTKALGSYMEVEQSNQQFKLKQAANAAEARRQAQEEAKAAKEKADKEANAKAFADAYWQTQNFTGQWVKDDQFREQGDIAFRQHGYEMVKKFEGLTGEQQLALFKDLDDTMDKEISYTVERTRKLNDELETEKRDIITKRVILGASSTLANLRNSNGSAEEANERVDQVIANVLSNTEYDERTKLQAVKALLNEHLSAQTDNANVSAALQRNLTAIESYAPEAEKITAAFEAGDLTASQKDAALQSLRLFYKVPDSFKDTDPFATEQEMARHLETGERIKKIQEGRVVEATKTMNLTMQSTGYLASLLLDNKEMRETLKTNPLYKERPYAKEAVRLAERYEAIQKENETDTKEMLRLRTEQTQLQAGAVKYLINNAPNNRSPSVRDMFAQLGLGQTTQEQARGFSAEQVATINAQTQAVEKTIVDRIAFLQNKITSRTSELKDFGLHIQDRKQLRETMKMQEAGYREQIAAFESVQQKQLEQDASSSPSLGVTSPTNGSGRSAQPTSVKRAKKYPSLYTVSVGQGNVKGNGQGYINKKNKVVLPFLPGTQGIVFTSSYQAADRTNHNGQDVAAPAGTKLVFYGYGKVIHAGNANDGFGNRIDIQDGNGMVHRFAHQLDGSIQVRKGDTVEPGQFIGKVGSTGNSTGPHLHWEVRKGGMWGQHINPMEYLSSHNNRDSVLRRPLGDTTGWSVQPETPSARVPKNAIPLGGGYYILKGKVQRLSNPGYVEEAGTKYSVAAPLTTGSVPTARSAYPKYNDPTQNYGYGKVANDKAFLKKVAQVSDKLGIPAMWLMDLMHIETATTFAASVDNGVGYSGLIQFGDAAARGVGTTRAKLMRMNRVQQMDYVYKYFASFKKSDLQKGPEYVMAAVWGGQGLIDRMNRGENVSKVNDFKAGGKMTFEKYVKKLGADVGRQYNSRFLRRDKLTASTHTSYNDGCRSCQALVASESNVVPHLAQA